MRKVVFLHNFERRGKIVAVETYTLPNGLRIIATPSPTKVVYCGYAVGAGTRNETVHEQGMAHFVEHLIFKGTQKRHAWHILNRMESVGGDLNAYTTKEETVVYSVFLEKDFSRALELLTDIVFRSIFPQNEINKEVEVILEEIQSYKDNPSELIIDEFENLLFENHPLGKNILGNPKQLRKFKSEDALDFVRRFYTTSNMVLFVHGNIPLKRIISLAEKYAADIPFAEAVKPHIELPEYQPRKLNVHKVTHQAHVIMGTRCYPAKSDKWFQLYLLNNLLGGPGMNSRLNVALRERLGLVYLVESNLTGYTDTGVFSIYFGSDIKDAERCIELTFKELKLMREKRLTATQLAAAKKQIIGEIGVSGDNFENIALEMGKNYLHYKDYETKQTVFQKIEEITAQNILDVANEILDEKNISILAYT